MPREGKKDGELMRALRLPSPLTKKPAGPGPAGECSFPDERTKKKDGATPSSAPPPFPPQQDKGGP